jgi:hypothetical protein
MQGYAPIVISDNWFPVWRDPDAAFLCVAPIAASDEEIIERVAQFGGNPNPPPAPGPAN